MENVKCKIFLGHHKGINAHLNFQITQVTKMLNAHVRDAKIKSSSARLWKTHTNSHQLHDKQEETCFMNVEFSSYVFDNIKRSL